MDKRITIYVDDQRYAEIVKIAQKEDRNISNMIDNIFKHYIEYYNSNVKKGKKFPKLADLKGIAPDLTEGLTPEEFVRKMRDEE